jgi:hypothetical protein
LDKDQFRELLRLRGEVGLLKEQLAQTKKSQPAKVESTIPNKSALEDAVEQQRKIELAKITYTGKWVLGFIMYADAHQQACPTDFKQAAAYSPEAASDTNFTTDQFQLVYQGPFNEITNPAETIVLRETEPMQAANGDWLKAYGFADGHSLIHDQPDSNFDEWESQHIQKPAGQ